MILDLLIITTIICIVTDLSGIISSLRWLAAKIISSKTGVTIDEEAVNLPKIMTCSSCQAWWICIIYVTISGNFSLFNLLLCALMHFFAKNITGFLQFIRELLVHFENLLYKTIGQ